MNLETVNYQQDGSVAIIKLNRPQAGNSLSAQLASDLLAAATGAAKDNNVRAVVFSAEGDFFCFGGDLKEFNAFGGGNPTNSNLSLTGYMKPCRFF